MFTGSPSNQRYRKRAAVAVAAALSAVALPGVSTARDLPDVAAAGRMRVSAATSSYTPLRLPQGAELPLDYTEPALAPPEFSGGHGLAGLVLVSASDASKTWSAVRLPDAPGVARPVISLGPGNCQIERTCAIPAGDYRLYVVTAQPVDVTFSLHGLRGRSSVTLTSRATAEMTPAEDAYYHSTPEGPVEGAAYGTGFTTAPTGERNFLFSAFWFRGSRRPAGPSPANQPLLQVGNAGSCFYNGAPPVEAYAPGCPGGAGSGQSSSAYALRQFGFMQWNALSGLPRGTYGRGYYAIHTGVHDPGAVGFWLDLTR